MKEKFFLKVKVIVVLLGLCLVQNIGWAFFSKSDVRITDIRYWQGPENAQLIFDLSNSAKITNLERLSDGTMYFDIEECKFKPGKAKYELKNEFITMLNVQMRIDGKVRVYFKLPDKIIANLYLLKKDENKPYRVVINFSLPADEIKRRTLSNIEGIKRLKKDNIKIVVIDPGHGGEDPGTIHNGIVEKNYVLEMAYLIKKYFDSNPKYKVILTRHGDYIIPLERRREIAEQLGADVFVSLHVNYNRVKSVRGIEVYYDSQKGAANEAERLVSEMENKQDEIMNIVYKNSSYSDEYINYKTKLKNNIINKQAENLYASGQLANTIEYYLSQAISGLPSRGVKRAGFRVLHSLIVPSILIEFGYISNYYDAMILKNNDNKLKFAEAVYKGIVAYLESNRVNGREESYIAFAHNYSPTTKSLNKNVLSNKTEKNKKQKVVKKNKTDNITKNTLIAKR